MATNPFTLAALATTAVPGIEVTGAVDDGSDADVEAVAARTADGRTLRVTVPRRPSALQRMQQSVVALGAFSPAVRDRLPFDVPALVGQSTLQRTGIFVWTRLGGQIMRLDDISPRHLALPASLGSALAAIHELPTSVIADAGLPHRSVAQVRQQLLGIFDEAAATGDVPRPLLERWERAADDAELWQFKPAVVHGDLSAAAFLRDGDDIVGVDGWHALSIGDPARDLAWLLGSAAFSSVDEVFARYSAVRGDRQLRQRAMLHAELDIAKWLLHGLSRHDQQIIDDAKGMLRGLVARVDDDDSVQIQSQRPETMDLTGVQSLLLSTGRGRAQASVSGDDGAGDETGDAAFGEAETAQVPSLESTGEADDVSAAPQAAPRSTGPFGGIRGEREV